MSSRRAIIWPCVDGTVWLWWVQCEVYHSLTCVMLINAQIVPVTETVRRFNEPFCVLRAFVEV